jgi:hypothetical protein
MQCPACLNFIVWLVKGELNSIVLSSDPDDEAKKMTEDESILLYPRTNKRPSCPLEVPAAIAQEYTEACLILYDSPTASAALSRRCLQHFLRDVVKVKPM